MALEIMRETNIESIVKRRQHRTSDGTYSFTRRKKRTSLPQRDCGVCLANSLAGDRQRRRACSAAARAQQPKRSAVAPPREQKINKILRCKLAYTTQFCSNYDHAASSLRSSNPSAVPPSNLGIPTETKKTDFVDFVRHSKPNERLTLAVIST